VAPLRFAAGIQNKVLEAMATETPVVTSSLVNEGLGATAGRDLLVADTHDELIQAIRQLIKQPAFAQQIGSQGSQFVNTYFSWENVLPAVAKWMPATGSHYHTNAY
jgi:glycosyltransferase involved in cell wall biosynthesis